MMDEVQRKLSVAEHHRPSSEPHRTKKTDLSPLHSVQTSSGAHQASYSMVTRGYSLRGKMARQ